MLYFDNFAMADERQRVHKKSRFAFTSVEDKQKLLDERGANNTKRATKSNLKTFTDYLTERDLNKLEDIPNDDLPSILYDFYTDLRKVDGQLYKLQSIKCIRSGIN